MTNSQRQFLHSLHQHGRALAQFRKTREKCDRTTLEFWAISCRMWRIYILRDEAERQYHGEFSR